MTTARAEFERFVKDDYAHVWHSAVKGWCSDFESRQKLEARIFGVQFECEPGDRGRIDELDRFWGRLLAHVAPRERFALELRSGLWGGGMYSDMEVVQAPWMKGLAEQGVKRLQARCAQLVFDAVMRSSEASDD